MIMKTLQINNERHSVLLKVIIFILYGFLYTNNSLAGENDVTGNVKSSGLRLATFDIDATPPAGSQMAYNTVINTWDLGLRARGIVLLGAGKPVILCSIDWIGISNESQDEFKRVLASAAGTVPERVAVHTIHQHDAPISDFGAERLLKDAGLDPMSFESTFTRRVMHLIEESVRTSVKQSQPVTHIGLGEAPVYMVASNRRIQGPDGRVRATRYTTCTDSALRAEPEGLIDPMVSLVSFWNGEKPLAVLSYYAVHPQSYYLTGLPNPDFPGLARFYRQLAVPEALHVHFNGAGGNLGAGKYNDGSHENRGILAERLADGMKRAWEASKREAITADAVSWEVKPVALPPAKYPDSMKTEIVTRAKDAIFLTNSISKMVFYNRSQEGRKIDIACLSLGRARILHMPGELFVEYQLAAKALRPDLFVAMAAYGDYGPGYICTDAAYLEGGYESSNASGVKAGSEKILMKAIGKLLHGKKNSSETKDLSAITAKTVVPPVSVTASGQPVKIAPPADLMQTNTAADLKLATFDVDATPPIGSILAYNKVVNLWDMSLRARGIVLLGAGKPIVLCSVDWISINNESQEVFKNALAEAAGTLPERVVIHTVHQHDAPMSDFSAERTLKESGLSPASFESTFQHEVIGRLVISIRKSLAQSQPVTHIGLGKAQVYQVASARRILGEDGMVKETRYSSCADSSMRAEPEGLIDPMVSLVSFWNNEKPLVVLSYYATHPQSYYLTGIPNPDFPGIARFYRQLAVPMALHVHFTGAGGNIAAGKYNDGSKMNRGILAERLADGMKRAWESTSFEPVSSATAGWYVEPVNLKPAKNLEILQSQFKTLDSVTIRYNIFKLERLKQYQAGKNMDISCLKLGNARILFMPGELFVEYQLAAKAERPDLFVTMAAYGDCGTGYIGTAIAYKQGGYETGPASGVTSEAEAVLMAAIKNLLRR
jgi:hypothetical protein